MLIIFICTNVIKKIQKYMRYDNNIKNTIFVFVVSH